MVTYCISVIIYHLVLIYLKYDADKITEQAPVIPNMQSVWLFKPVKHNR